MSVDRNVKEEESSLAGATVDTLDYFWGADAINIQQVVVEC